MKESNGYIPTAEEINNWSICGIGHDSINRSVCIRAKCERLGYEIYCKSCGGHGDIWDSQEEKTAYEDWKETEPPVGEGWQLWETVTEGSPVSPVLATPEELASWLVCHDTSITKDCTYENWMKFFLGNGFAASSVRVNGGWMSGVKATCN